MDNFRQDLRYGVRVLLKKPSFTFVAALTLALGIGANTAIFSVVNAVLLKPLPYRNPERLVAVSEIIMSDSPKLFSAPDFEDFERENQVFEHLAAYQNKQYELSGADPPERLIGARVSASLFPSLGIEPAIGRSFTAEDDRQGRLVVMLNDGLWKRRFGGDPGIIGRTITLDRQPYEVVAVMPPDFEFPLRGPEYNNEPASLWVPISFTNLELQGRGSGFNKSAVARLKPGVTLEQADAEVKTIASRIHEQYPPILRENPNWVLSAEVSPLSEEVAGGARTALLILMGAVTLVMLIGCADVANLLLTRAAGRQKEMAIRIALGASRMQLIRQSLIESLLLALIAAALGLLLAMWGIELLPALAPENIPGIEQIRIDAVVLGFTLLLSIATALLFGLAPALEASRAEVNEALKESSRSATLSKRRRFVLGSLVVAQFAMALVLLIGSGLLVRSFARLISTDPGFRPEQVLSMSLTLPSSAYGKADQVRSFHERLIERIEALPGVQAAGTSNELPLAIRERRIFTPERAMEDPSWTSSAAANVYVMGRYFEGLGVALKSGRYFNRQDGRTGDPVIMISEMMARRFWPGEDPVGQRMKWGMPQSRTTWMTIVGVVGDVKQGSLDTEAVPQVYEPLHQVPDIFIEKDFTNWLRTMNVVARAETDPASLIAAVRKEVSDMDASMPITNIQTMEQRVSDSVLPQRFNATLLTAFAAIALALAAIGIYGVMAYSVAQRTHEIGIRMALGARNRDVLKLVVGQGMKLALMGVAIGLVVAFFLTRLMESLLFGVTSTDPATFALISFALILVALAACYIPARRAMKVDPMEALRYE